MMEKRYKVKIQTEYEFDKEGLDYWLNMHSGYTPDYYIQELKQKGESSFVSGNGKYGVAATTAKITEIK